MTGTRFTQHQDVRETGHPVEVKTISATVYALEPAPTAAGEE
jgi:hypothetical protein